MCGIVGLVGAGRDERSLLALMNASQRHRGPDDEGSYFDVRDGVALAMRRLSILDLAGGHQPMASADGALCIVYNGEIVNAPALRTELEAAGFVFRTDHCDTEVLLQLYARDGERMLEHLNGMFAFVIHDRRRRILFGARDQFGIKPLYYALSGPRFAFASELKSLAGVEWIDRRIEPQALSDYLSFQCVPSPRTIYRGAAKLPAAHSFVLRLDGGGFTTARYWAPPTGNDAHERLTGEDLAREVRQEFERAVGRWMLSDVPIACSLSGGIDSSAILGVMAGRSTRPIDTYSLGFDDAPEIDERALARAVAQRFGTAHHEIVLRSEDLLGDLDRMVASLDEPYAGGLPSWFVFRGMAGAVKVCMTGTGGDELFGNYGKWRLYEAPLRGLRMVTGLARRPGWLADFRRFPLGSRYPLYFREFEKQRSLLEPAWLLERVPAEAVVEAAWRASGARSPRDAVRCVDLAIQLPDEFLHMTDRFSMAHSIEARPPFLDRVLCERLMRIPARSRVGHRVLKQVLIDAVRDLLPVEVITAPKKGFVLPVASWLRGRLRPEVEHYLGADYLRAQGIFRPSVYRRIVSPFLGGRRDQSSRIWTLLMFQLWQARGANP